jgi:predicted site-specific integrase-resolvase
MAAKSSKRSVKQDSHRGPWSTVEVAGITEINRMTISRWLEAGNIRAPKQDPRSKEYLWTQADIDEVVKFAKSRERIS